MHQKGVKIPGSVNKQFKTTQSTVAANHSAVHRTSSAASNVAEAVKKTSAATSEGGAWLVWLAMAALSVYLNTVLPIGSVMGMDIIEYIPIGEVIWVPAIAVVLGVIIRRKKANMNSFWKHWLLQSFVMTVGNYINMNVFGIAGTTGGYFLSIAGVTFCVGLLTAWATAPFAKKKV